MYKDSGSRKLAAFLKNLNFFYKSFCFVCFELFLCVNFKNNFLKIKKNIILIYFNIKNILKNKSNHISKQTGNLPNPTHS